MAFMITSLLCFFLFSVDITLATMTDRELVVDQHFHSNQNTRAMTVRSFGSGTTEVKWLKWSEEISPDEPEQAAGGHYPGHYAIHLTFTNSTGADHNGMVQEGLQSLSASNPFMSIIRVTETQEGQLEVHLQLSGSSSAGLWLPGWKYDPRHSGFSVDTAEDAPVRSFELVEYFPEYSDTKAEDSSAEDTASFATSAMVPDDYASPDEIKPETPNYGGYGNDADDTPYPPRHGGRPLPAYLWFESDEAVLTVPGMGGEKKRQTVIFVVLQAGGNSYRKEITYEEYKMLARQGLHKSSEMLYLLFHDSKAFRQQVNALNTLGNLDLDRFMLLPYLKKIQRSLMAADDLPFIEVPEVIILTEAQVRYKQSPENKGQSGSRHRSQLPGGDQGLSGGSGRTGNPGKNMGKDKDDNGGFSERNLASVPSGITQLCEHREAGDCVGDVCLYRVSGARDLYLCQMHRSQQEPADRRSRAAGIQSQTVVGLTCDPDVPEAMQSLRLHDAKSQIKPTAEESLQQLPPGQKAKQALIKHRANLKQKVDADMIIDRLEIAAGGFMSAGEVGSVQSRQHRNDKMDQIISILNSKLVGDHVQAFRTFISILRATDYYTMAELLERDSQLTGGSGEPGRTHTVTGGEPSPVTRQPPAQAKAQAMSPPGKLSPLTTNEADMLVYFRAYFMKDVVWDEDNPVGLNLAKFERAAGGFLDRSEMVEIEGQPRHIRIKKIIKFLRGKNHDDFVTFIRLIKESEHPLMIKGAKESLDKMFLSPCTYGL